MRKRYFQEVYANRVASICGLNFPPFLDTMLRTIFLPFMSEALKNKVRLCIKSDSQLKVFRKKVTDEN